MSTELVVVDESSAMEIFTANKGLDPIIDKIRAEIDSFVPDTSTAKGRKEIASFSAKVARSKTYLDGVGKDLVAELKKKPKLIDAERRRMRNLLDDLKAEARQPLTDWEEEQAAIKLREKIEADHAEAIAMNELFDREAEIERKEAELKAKAEAESLKREQAEREEKLKREAAEKARIEAEQKAAREKAEAQREAAEQRLAAERAEQARIDAEKRAEREKIEAAEHAEREKQQAIEAEREKAAAAERARLELERMEKLADEKRAADKEHRRAVNRKAMESLAECLFLEDETAKQIVMAIAGGKIDNVSINY